MLQSRKTKEEIEIGNTKEYDVRSYRVKKTIVRSTKGPIRIILTWTLKERHVAEANVNVPRSIKTELDAVEIRASYKVQTLKYKNNDPSGY